jgi:hypothetical protein
MSDRPYVFVLMPFGKKPDAVGNTIDFDRVYDEIIKPAVESAGWNQFAPTRKWVVGSFTNPCMKD